jgi:hypothetical protein
MRHLKALRTVDDLYMIMARRYALGIRHSRRIIPIFSHPIPTISFSCAKRT